jgi:hypothetical protein
MRVRWTRHGGLGAPRHGKETQRRAAGKATGIDGTIRLKWL